MWDQKDWDYPFKMYNRVVKTLIEVQYVLDLQKNLFSLEVLESSSYKIIMHDGILREIYGILVALRGTRIEDLYFMDESIITSRVTISKSLENDKTDNFQTLAHVYKA